MPSETRRLRRIVEGVDPDVVHLHSSKAGMAGRLAVRGRRPTIFQPHAWSFDAVRGPVRAASLAWERFAQRWTTELVCVSLSERVAGERHGISAPVTLALNGSTWPGSRWRPTTSGGAPAPASACSTPRRWSASAGSPSRRDSAT